jgi:hypothetical protein
MELWASMLRKRPSNEDPEKVILDVLGARAPLWQREWTPEAMLVDLVDDRRMVLKVLSRLGRTPGVVLRAQRAENGQYWFLERYVREPGLSIAERAASDEPVAEPESGQVGGADSPRAFRTASTPETKGLVDPSSPIRSTKDPPPHQLIPTEPSHKPHSSSQVDLLRRALTAAGIPVAEIDPNVQNGHSVDRYLVLLAGGARIEALRRRAEDIGRDVGSEVLVSQLPNQRRVAIDIARPDREVAPFGPALEALHIFDHWDGLHIPLGITPAGERVALDLSEQPNVAIAGATGAGKTMLEKTGMAALALRMPPEQLGLLLIDPKALDFTAFAGLPHLMGGHIVTEPEDAIDSLCLLTEEELPRRTQILKDAGCVSLRELHAKRPDLKLGYLVVVVDEYADLVTVLGGAEHAEFEKQVRRLTQRARAVGIHLVIATQRPSTDFVTGAVKANLPTRISFRLPQRSDSMVIIDQPGAERLLGAGDMLLWREGRLQRLQGYFASTEEIARLLADRIEQLKGDRE